MRQILFQMAKKIYVINGEKVKEYRLLNGMTQQDLADKAQLSVSVLSKIENGVHRNVRTSTLFELATVLECDVTEIVINKKSKI